MNTNDDFKDIDKALFWFAIICIAYTLFLGACIFSLAIYSQTIQ